MIKLDNLFWDSCVFIRYLTGNPDHRLTDIGEFIRDAQKGQRRIWFSTIAFTEIRPSHLKLKGYGSVADFMEDMAGAFTPIDPNPNILMMAGEMRDVRPLHPQADPKAQQRTLGTPDAIHLASCLHVRDVLGVQDIVFHTFDNGKGSVWEGKCVPLLSFQDWYKNGKSHQHIAAVCALPRKEPIYPQLGLFAGTT